MIDERHEELAALYVLDLLEGGELSAFEAELANDPALQALVRDLRDTTGSLALAVPTAVPSSELKARLLRQIQASTSPAPVVPFRPPSFLPWALAAGFAALTVWLGQSLLTTRKEAQSQQTESRLTQLALREARNRLEAERIILDRRLADSTRQLGDSQHQLADATAAIDAAGRQLAALNQQLQVQGDLANLKIATLASMLGNSPQALAVAVWNPSRQEGVLTVEKLPVLPRDQDYQLWVVDPAYQNPVNGGVFTVDGEGVARVQFKADQPISAIKAFAVTRERKGGVPKAEGPFVLLSK